MTLLDTVLKAHHESALRGNPSHCALVLAATGSGDYFKALAAALMTLGGTHAPLAQTYDLLASDRSALLAQDMLFNGRRVPGWGSGFVKNEIDPIWLDCDRLIRDGYPAIAETIVSITDVLHRSGKRVYPNPSCYTAATALALGVPREAIGEILVRGRLNAWTTEYQRVVKESPVLV